MHLLMRASWPGNTAQLWECCDRSPSAAAPARSCRPICRPSTTPRRADRSIGMNGRAGHHRAEPRGRRRQQGQGGTVARHLPATIYRKIHEYGIVTPTAEPAQTFHIQSAAKVTGRTCRGSAAGSPRPAAAARSVDRGRDAAPGDRRGATAATPAARVDLGDQLQPPALSTFFTQSLSFPYVSATR